MTPGIVLGWFLSLWLAVFGAIVTYRLVTGQIVVAGILSAPDGRFSPERLQLFLFTVAGLLSFAAAAFSEHRLPPIPDALLGVFAASHAVYLGGKLTSR